MLSDEHRAKSILPTPVIAPFFPRKCVQKSPSSLSCHQAVVSDQAGVPGTPAPSVIVTKKSICAALPSLPHTRVTLSQLNGRFFQNVMQIKTRHAVSTG